MPRNRFSQFRAKSRGEANGRIRHRVKNVGPNPLNVGFTLKTCLRADREPGPLQRLSSSLSCLASV